MPATLSCTGKLVSVIKSKLSWLDMSVCKLGCNEDHFVLIYEYLPLLHIILNNTLITPNGIFVAPLREILKYMRYSIILEGCKETLHNGATELHNGSSITLLGSMIVSAIKGGYCNPIFDSYMRNEYHASSHISPLTCTTSGIYMLVQPAEILHDPFVSGFVPARIPIR